MVVSHLETKKVKKQNKTKHDIVSGQDQNMLICLFLSVTHEVILYIKSEND